MKLSKCAVWVVLSVASVAWAEPRIVEGRIVDGTTREAVPFANIGVPDAGVGTVGGEDGTFTLAVGTADAVAVFSAIGYETRRIPVSIFPEDGQITMTAMKFGFREEITVTAETSGDAAVFGKQYAVPGYGFGFGNGQLGSEVAARIVVKKRTLLETANFTITRTGGKRFLYRVKVYDFKSDEPGENLLRKNVIVSADQKRGVLTVDLREHLLVVENDVLLSLEWIRADEQMDNANIMFRAKPRSKGVLYFRPASQMNWMKVPRHGLGFFLTGHPLE